MTMRYITEVRIQNFQSHANTVLRLHPGLNAITGPSDNGKSAILRAVRWAAWNQAPDGDWVRQGANNSAVTLVISDGTRITRERRGKRNIYTMERPDEEPLELADFGHQVPLEVLEAHGMLPIAFDPNRPSLLNLATQLEAPFFITDPAPQRARMLSRLAGVHVADHGIKLANADLQAIARDAKVHEEELARLSQQLERYAGLDEEEERLARAEAALAAVGPLVSQLEKLAALRKSWQRLAAEVDLVQRALQQLLGVDAAANRVTAAEQAHERQQHLWELADELPVTLHAIAMLEHTLEWAARVLPAGPMIDQAQETGQHLDTLRKLQATRDQIRTDWAETRAILKRTAGAADAAGRIANAQQAGAMVQQLRPLRESWRRLDSAVSETEQIIRRCLRREQAAGIVEAAAHHHELASSLRGLAIAHADATARISKGQEYIENKDRELDGAAADYARALRETARCPTCLQSIDAAAADEIAAGLAHTHQ